VLACVCACSDEASLLAVCVLPAPSAVPEAVGSAPAVCGLGWPLVVASAVAGEPSCPAVTIVPDLARSLVTSPTAAEGTAAAVVFAGAGGGGGGAPRRSTVARGCAVLAAELAPASAAVPSLPLPSSLPEEVFGGEAGGPGVFAAIALAAAMSAAAFGCEFGLFGSLGVFPVVPAACVVLPGALAAVLAVAGVVPVLEAFEAEPPRF
jgi:hypothetical protein